MVVLFFPCQPLNGTKVQINKRYPTEKENKIKKKMTHYNKDDYTTFSKIRIKKKKKSLFVFGVQRPGPKSLRIIWLGRLSDRFFFNRNYVIEADSLPKTDFSSMSDRENFVNSSRFNLHFYETRNCHLLYYFRSHWQYYQNQQTHLNNKSTSNKKKKKKKKNLKKRLPPQKTRKILLQNVTSKDTGSCSSQNIRSFIEACLPKKQGMHCLLSKNIL